MKLEEMPKPGELKVRSRAEYVKDVIIPETLALVKERVEEAANTGKSYATIETLELVSEALQYIETNLPQIGYQVQKFTGSIRISGWQ